MRNRKIIFGICGGVVVVLGFIEAFAIGAKVGAEYSRNSMAPVRAFQAYSEISRLKGGKVDLVLNSKEAEIDNELYFWGTYVQGQEGLGDLLFPEHRFDRDKFIRAAVKYRLENPRGNLNNVEKSSEAPSKAETSPASGQDFTTERKRVIEDVLHKYAGKAVAIDSEQ